MVDPVRFGNLIKPLEDLHKKRTPEQQRVLYDKFKYTNEDVLLAAIDHLVEVSKGFPTPGDIKTAIREAGYNKIKQSSGILQEKGCACCLMGYVHYERPKGDRNAWYVSDCAYCHQGEISIIPQLVQKNDQIYYACEKFMDGSTQRYRANQHIQEIFFEATPVNTSAFLKEYFNSKPTGVSK